MQNIKYILFFIIICSCNTANNKNETTISNQQEELITEDNLDSSKQINSKRDSVIVDKVEEIFDENLPKKEQKIEHLPTSTKPKQEPKIEKFGSLLIEEPLFDFGRVNEGTIIEHEFEIKNIGNAVLHITNIEVDCGCTVPEYNKEGIAPGATDKIKVTFDTTGKLASQVRYITVMTDGKPLSKLVRLKGLVATD